MKVSASTLRGLGRSLVDFGQRLLTLANAVEDGDAVLAESEARDLTPKQREVFLFIKEHYLVHGAVPSGAEVARRLGLTHAHRYLEIFPLPAPLPAHQDIEAALGGVDG